MNSSGPAFVAQTCPIAAQVGISPAFANAGNNYLPDGRIFSAVSSKVGSGLTSDGGGGDDSGYRPKIVLAKWGTLGIFEPRGCAIDRMFILLVPGFTGDGFSHTEFIAGARRHGYGVLALTPKWSDRVGENIDHMRGGIDCINRTVDSRIIRVVRANSFGAYLATQVLDRVPSIDTAIFIAPCSATQLSRASQYLGRSIEVDRESLIPRLIQRGLIYMIAGDIIVPALDTHFESVIQEREVRICEGDHFTVANDAKCCSDSLAWLGGLRE